MKQFNKKIALIALLSFNMTPVQAEIKMTDITSPIISTAMSAAGCYILVTHLIKQDALVLTACLIGSMLAYFKARLVLSKGDIYAKYPVIGQGIEKLR